MERTDINTSKHSETVLYTSSFTSKKPRFELKRGVYVFQLLEATLL